MCLVLMDGVLFGKGAGEGAVMAGWGARKVEVGRQQLFTEGNEICSVMEQFNWHDKRCGLSAVLTFSCERCR
jgi:hypothetical protein